MTRQRKAADKRWRAVALGSGAGIAMAVLAVALADRPAPPRPRVAVPIATKRPMLPPVAPPATIVSPPHEPVGHLPQLPCCC